MSTRGLRRRSGRPPVAGSLHPQNVTAELWRRMEIRPNGQELRSLCTLRRRRSYCCSAVVLTRIFGDVTSDTYLISLQRCRGSHSCTARGSIAGSRDAQNVSSVVAKDGGQQESSVVRYGCSHKELRVTGALIRIFRDISDTHHDCCRTLMQ